MTELFTDVGARRGRQLGLVARWVWIGLIALGGLIGQRPSRSQASSPAPIEHPRLVCDDGWLVGMQVNSVEPAAESESSRDGRLVLSYGGLETGDILRVHLQFEVNPTNVGTRSW